MKNIVPLQKRAIEAAKTEDWQLAEDLNQEIIKEDANNIGALNRLALAQMQLGKVSDAKKNLSQVLKLDKHNKIAIKNLAQAKKKQKGKVVRFSQGSSYIEEPGKAKIVNLIRITDKKILNKISVGQACQLDAGKAYISVVTDEDGQYIGTLPRDVSQRIIKLINSGNKYKCTIHSIEADKTECSVHVQETHVSSVNQGVTSFPVSSVQADYQDPEILSLEHKLKNDLPVEFFDENEDETDKLSKLDDSEDENVVGSIDEDEDE